MPINRAARRLVLTLAMVLASPLQAQTPTATPTTIRIWGHGHRGADYILTLLHAWQEAFHRTHPEVQFADELTGNAGGLGGLYTHVADLALLDREASFIEVDAYQQGMGYDPFRIAVAQGSDSKPHHAPALKVLVNRANPLTRLSVDQLDSIFDADHRRGGPSIKTWGDLGLVGKWAAKPIRIYTYNVQSAEVQFFERAALKGSQKFRCCLTFFANKPGQTADQQIAAAVEHDLYGLALAILPHPQLKPIPLAASASTPAVLPTDATIIAGTYPLARTVYIYANRKPKSALNPIIAAFLTFIISPAGQDIAAHTGEYLPLTDAGARAAREALQ